MAESYSVKAVLSAYDKNFTSTLKGALGGIDSLKSKVTSGIGFGAMMAIGQKAVGVLSNGVSELISEIDDSNKAWKTFSSNMEIAGKSKKEIQTVKKELQDFATKTIYNASDMASTYAQLEAVGTKNTTSLVKGFGGLAAAAIEPKQAMKTLSTQATQMAAKPTVAWQDFKLMMEQTPAGVAAVAKQMGMSAQELVANVQDGKVATQDFFDAIAEVGTNEQFTEMATTYKTIGEAMDGLKETLSVKLGPAWEEMSQTAIGAIEKVIGKVGSMDMTTALSAENIKSVAKSLGVVLGGAFSISGGIPLIEAIGTVPGIMSGVTSKAKTMGSGLKKALDSNYTKTTLNKIAADSGKTVNEIRSDVGKLAGQYRKSGLNASEAMKKAYQDIGMGSGSMKDKVKAAFNSALEGPKKFAGNTKKIFSSAGDIGKMILPDSLTSKVSKLSGGVKAGLDKVVAASTTAGGKVKGVFSKSLVLDTESPLARIIGFGKKASGSFKELGSALASNMGMGLSAVQKIGGSMTKVFGFALKAVGPAAIVGLVIAALGILDSQFGTEINKVLQKATESGPQIIQNLVNGILSELPSLMSSGSQMLASFLNMITANLPAILSGGSDIVIALVQGVITNLPTLLPAAVSLITTLITGIGQNLPGIITVGLQLIMALVTGIVQNLPQIVVAAIDALTSFVNGISSNMPMLLEQAVKMIDAIVKGISSALPKIGSAGLKLIVTIAKAIINNLPSILSAGSKIVQSLLKGILNLLGQVLSAGGKLASSVANGISKKVSAVSKAGKNVVNALKSAVTGGLSAARKWGADLVGGIASGIRGAIGKVKSAASSVASSIKSFLHFSRPDRGPLRPYEKWMPDFMKGLAGGIKDNIGLIKKSVGAVADSMTLDDLVLCPTLGMDTLNLGRSFGNMSDLKKEYTYGRSGTYTIVVPLDVDGREFAKATATYNQEEIDKLEKRNNRKKGHK